MGKGCCLPVRSDTRCVFVGSSEGLEGWVWGCWQVVGSPVLLIQGTLHSGSSWTTWHARQGCREWRAFLYVTSYCMPSLLPFLSFSFSFTSMVLRFINSLFMPSAAIRMSKKEARENPVFSCLSLFTGLAYLLFPLCFFFWRKFCVAALHQARVSFLLLPSLLLLLIVLVRFFPPGKARWERSAVRRGAEHHW